MVDGARPRDPGGWGRSRATGRVEGRLAPEVRAAGGAVLRPGPTAEARSSSSIVPATGTGPCRRGRSSGARRTRSARFARSPRRPASTASSGLSSARAGIVTGAAATKGGSLLGHDGPGRGVPAERRRWTRSAGCRSRPPRGSYLPRRPRDPGRDRAALRSLVLLVRHAKAGDRERWTGDDRLRPLDKRGRRQADAMVGPLAGLSLTRLVSSPYVRCVQTLEPLSARVGMAVESDRAIAEGASVEEARALPRAARARPGGPVHARGRHGGARGRGGAEEEGLDLAPGSPGRRHPSQSVTGRLSPDARHSLEV